MKRFFAACFVLLAGVAFAASDILPGSRPVLWEPGVQMGVIGGIPSGTWTVIDMTAAPYNCDPTGVADCQAAVDSAISTVPFDRVLYFPDGTYRLSYGFNMNARYEGRIAIRGGGMFRTTLNYESSQGFLAGQDPGWGQFAFNAYGTVTPGDLTIGATTIHVTALNANSFVSNYMIRFSIPNDWTVPVTTYHDGNYLRAIFNRVVTATNTGGSNWTLTLAVPLPISQSTGTIYVEQPQPGFQPRHDMGIEDLTMNGVNGGGGIWFGGNTYNIWAKNVRITGFCGAPLWSRMALKWDECFGAEIRGCFVPQAGTLPAEMATRRPIVLDTGTATACYAYNNIWVDNYCHFLAEGSLIGSAVGYNFCKTGFAPELGIIGFSISHIPHSQSNLFEGNILDVAQEDNYHGGASHNTWHRNWFLSLYNPQGWTAGLPTSGTAAYSWASKRWSRQGLVAGNISGVPGVNPAGSGFSIGYPNMGNSFYFSESSLIGTDGKSPWQDWSVALGKPHTWRATVLSREIDPEGPPGSDAERGVVQITSGDVSAAAARIATSSTWIPTDGNSGFGVRWVTGSHSHGAMAGWSKVISGNQVTLSSRYGTNIFLPAVGQEVWIYPSSWGFQELDRDGYATTKFRENRGANGALLSANEGTYDHTTSALLGGETMSASYMFPGGAPPEMAGYAWPPFAPEVGIGTLTIARNRAGTNYLQYLSTGEFSTENGPITQVYMPNFSPPGGTYPTAQTVTITCPMPATIRYTTNGTNPSPTVGTIIASGSSVLLLTVAGTPTVLKAIAYDGVLTNSLVRTATYTVGIPPVEPPPTGGAPFSVRSELIGVLGRKR